MNITTTANEATYPLIVPINTTKGFELIWQTAVPNFPVHRVAHVLQAQILSSLEDALLKHEDELDDKVKKCLRQFFRYISDDHADRLESCIYEILEFYADDADSQLWDFIGDYDLIIEDDDDEPRYFDMNEQNVTNLTKVSNRSNETCGATPSANGGGAHNG